MVLTYAKLAMLTGFVAVGDALYDHFSEESECFPLVETFDNNALMKCASVNPGGSPFGDTQKQMEWVTICPAPEGSDLDDEADLIDLKLSITNLLFGGDKRDGTLTKSDCEAKCVYSLANKDLDGSTELRDYGRSAPAEYKAYHWNGSCWERVSADWCLQNVEMPRYLQLDTPEALEWRFPAFKVKNFCPPAEESTPTSAPSMGSALPPLPEDPQSNIPPTCVDQDDYNCPQRYLLGFCSMSSSVKAAFVAKCPGCCPEEAAEEPAAPPAKEEPTPAGQVNGRRRAAPGFKRRRAGRSYGRFA